MKSPIVTVTILAEIEIPILDAGYIGSAASIDEHVKWAFGNLANYTFLVKEGGLEPKRVSPKYKIKSVVLVPGDAR